MIWQYTTILFEFQKDGILGDRYIDEDAMQEVLNEQGIKGWELVNVTPVQEGLLSFFKRAVSRQGKGPGVTSGGTTGPGVRSSAPADRSASKSSRSAEKDTAVPVGRQGEKPVRKPVRPGVVGDIKIS